jgi:hypothetical protein
MLEKQERLGVKLMPTCRDITRMVLAAEAHPLGAGARFVVRAHWLICKGCNNFGKQIKLMRKATARWRGYTRD